MLPVILALVLIVFMWIEGDVDLSVKLLLTAVYLVSWGLLPWSPPLMCAAHTVLAIIFGAIAFGADWLNQRM